jgi:hypothetical protein
MQIHDINFLIIGATKSATTWLQQSLQQDASVYMPDPELHFFSRNFEKGQDWYLSQFDDRQGRRMVGEKSNSYMDTPEVAGRIKAAVPNVLLIAQLRNPVDRAYSDYCMLYRRGEVGRDVAQYLDPRVANGSRFLSGGLYHQQLRRYLDHFPVEQLKVLLYENIRSAPQDQLNSVRHFLNLTTELQIPPVTKKVKDKTEPVISPGLRHILKPLKPVLAPFRNSGVFKTLRSAIAHETNYSPLSPDLCARMIDFYAPEAEQLGSIIKQDLSPWLNAVTALKLHAHHSVPQAIK